MVGGFWALPLPVSAGTKNRKNRQKPLGVEGRKSKRQRGLRQKTQKRQCESAFQECGVTDCIRGGWNRVPSPSEMRRGCGQS